MKRVSRIFVACLLLAAMIMCFCGCGPQEPEVPANKVSVTFKLNNGFGEVTVEMDEGKVLNNAPTPTMRGAVFAGWGNGKKTWDMANDKVTEGLVLSARWTLAEDAMDKDPNAGVRSEGTDLRVCSFNALKTEGVNVTPVKDRIGGMLDMLQNYKMDIVSFQEFDNYWKNYFSTKGRPLNWALISDTLKDDKAAFHDIGYNTETVTLIECGKVPYETPSGYASDFVWAIFETKDTDKHRFLVTSLAWNYNTPQYRLEQCEFMSNWINEKKAETNLPVISMGDYNDVESSDPCKNILANTSMLDAKAEAPRKGLVGKSFHTLPEKNTYTNSELNTLETIDHIYYTSEISALYYDVIISNYVLVVSDHNPIYADIKFN